MAITASATGSPKMSTISSTIVKLLDTVGPSFPNPYPTEHEPRRSMNGFGPPIPSHIAAWVLRFVGIRGKCAMIICSIARPFSRNQLKYKTMHAMLEQNLADTFSYSGIRFFPDIYVKLNFDGSFNPLYEHRF